MPIMAKRMLRKLLGLTPDCGSSEEDEHAAAIAVVAEIDAEECPPRIGGSVYGHRTVHRGRLEGHMRLYADYFADKPVYGEETFRRRFRMTRRMFLRIVDAVQFYDPTFVRRRNAAGTLGCSPLQKVTAAIRMLAYGGPADALDEYVRMGESTIIDSLQRFVRAIHGMFGRQYLRAPNQHDIAALLAVAEARGFPSMLGSIDCMHWSWEKCPVAWQGMYTGHIRKPTLILEAVASYDLWIWHAYFDLPGSLNDINVLHRSPVFDDLASGNAPAVNFTVSGHEYDMGYYLADGIYPNWATLVKGISMPRGRKMQLFTTMQHAYRKDVERAFAVLQSKYAITKGPARFWETDDLQYIMYACVILHNMSIEDEHEMSPLRNEDYEGATAPTLSSDRNVPPIIELIARHEAIRSLPTNQRLQQDLLEHVWAKHGEE